MRHFVLAENGREKIAGSVFDYFLSWLLMLQIFEANFPA